MRRALSIAVAVLTTLMLASAVSAGMVGTHVTLDVLVNDAPVDFLPQFNATVIDPGIEFSFMDIFTADFTDTTVSLHFLLPDWNPSHITFKFTNDTPGAFNGLTLLSSNFPAPPNGVPNFSVTDAVLTFDCCVEGDPHLDLADFWAGLGPFAVAAPASMTMLSVGIAAIFVSRTMKRRISRDR